jgi:hypothetical protein
MSNSWPDKIGKLGVCVFCNAERCIVIPAGYSICWECIRQCIVLRQEVEESRDIDN